MIEMVLVVFLIGLTASSLLIVVDGVDDQERYEETARRLERIHDSILGTPDLVLNGSPMINGFIADMGALPDELADLVDGARIISPAYDAPDAYGVVGNGAIDDVRVYHGWRGPYLSTASSQLKDAWGAAFEYQSTPDLEVYSFGKDRALGGGESSADYAADYPAETSQVIAPERYAFSGGTIEVTIINKNGPEKNVILGILYPGLDTSDQLGDYSTAGSDYHESIIWPLNDGVDEHLTIYKTEFDAIEGLYADKNDDGLYDVGEAGLQTITIPMAEEFPSKLIRKFQLILYSKPASSEPLEDIDDTVHDQIFVLLPQNEHVLQTQIVIE